MAALTFDALLRGLKQGAPQPVYYLHGEEDMLKEEAIRALLDRVVEPAMRDFNVDVRAAGELDPAGLHALVNTPPMLAARRAVVLRGVEQLRKKSPAREELLHYLANPNPSTLLVLVQSGPAPEPEADLAAHATAAAAAGLVGPVLEMAGMSGVRIVSALGTALVGTALARAELDRGGSPPRQAEDAVFRHVLAARPFGLGSYKAVAARWVGWAGAWQAAELARALRAALAADRALKGTTVTDDRGIVLQLVLEFAAPRREAA